MDDGAKETADTYAEFYEDEKSLFEEFCLLKKTEFFFWQKSSLSNVGIYGIKLEKYFYELRKRKKNSDVQPLNMLNTQEIHEKYEENLFHLEN